MKLITLGTSHGDPTAIRFSSSNALEIGSSIYIIDAGNPVNALYIKKYTNDFSRVKAVFITHMHDDHAGGLPSFIKSFIKYPKEGMHAHIFLPEEAELPLRAWLRAMHLDNFDRLLTFHVTKPGEVYRDGHLRVCAVATDHIHSDGAPLTFAYRFYAEGKTVLYTGDMAYDFSDFPAEDITEHGADLCVCECTHYDPYVALEVFRGLPIKRMLFNHVGDRNATEDGAKRWTEIFKGCGFPCTVAHDGDEYYI